MAKVLSQIPELKKLSDVLTKWEDEGKKPHGTTASDMNALVYVFNDLFRYKKAMFIQAALVDVLKKCGIAVTTYGIGYMAERQ